IMKRKPPALHNIGIDLNPRALAAFECDYPVKKVNDCAHRFLAEYDYGGRELIYSDPPYLHHTRTSGRRYRFDYEEQDHIELLELLKTLPCNVILSGYPSALYDERLAGWRTLELQVMNHAGVRTEKLWFNFTPDRVHWASCAGRNFTDRQRIRRRAANWGKNYRALRGRNASRCCQPWRAKRRLVDPSSREAALFSRRALRQRENKVGL
ncbi:hypothetical protein, partial [Thiolapillus sp.]|uniref:hypothetical protein n=1 Tax=Thiolapillus sp. TaxID=2017437 RepID=UPI003AF69A40